VSIAVGFDRKGAQDQAIFCVGDKNFMQTDQTGFFVNRFDDSSIEKM